MAGVDLVAHWEARLRSIAGCVDVDLRVPHEIGGWYFPCGIRMDAAPPTSPARTPRISVGFGERVRHSCSVSRVDAGDRVNPCVLCEAGRDKCGLFDLLRHFYYVFATHLRSSLGILLG